MSSSSGIPGSKRDPVWKYCTQGSKTGQTICSFCNYACSGGPNRMKYHLARISGRNCRLCEQVPTEVQREMNAYLEAFESKKESRKKTREELGRPPVAPPHFPSDSEESQSQSSIGPRLRQGQGSPANIGSAVGCDRLSSRSSLGSQPSLEASWNKEKIAEAIKACANFWYFCNIPCNVARSPYWEYMVNAIALAGPGFQPPSYHDLQGSCLQTATLDIQMVIEEQKREWKKMGCSILTDGWTDSRGRTLINFMVSCMGRLVFLKSVDASANIKNSEYLFKLIEEVIIEVDPANVVQVITDNATTYVSAGRLIEERFPTIFWTPCAAHCLDLLLEDIGKIDWVKEVLEKAKSITKFIYNHAWVLSLMRRFTEGKDLIRSGSTRFATSFLSLQSLYGLRVEVKQMFVTRDWLDSKYAKDSEGEKVCDLYFEKEFWTSAEEILQSPW